MSKEREQAKGVEEKGRLLVGKNAIVTGGASGIGKAVVKEFILQGATVSIFDINEEAIKQTLSELQSLGEIYGYPVDVTDEKGLQKSVDKVEKVVGPVDTLVNNAGVIASYPLEEYPLKEWNRVLDVNLTGSFLCTKIIGGRMKEKGIRGTIIFVTSVHTTQAFPHNSAYDAAKHGMVGLMRAAAVEWGPLGIRSNAIAPGAIYPTGMTPPRPREEVDQLGRRIPLGRMGKPEEIAAVAAFLASNQASYLNGAEIKVDAGLAIKTALVD